MRAQRSGVGFPLPFTAGRPYLWLLSESKLHVSPDLGQVDITKMYDGVLYIFIIMLPAGAPHVRAASWVALGL